MTTLSKPPRPFTRARARQNAAFLAVLRRTGNASVAAREAGLSLMTFLRRRASHPAFAVAWEAALVVVEARLSGRPGAARPGGEIRVVRSRSGRVQVRRMAAGTLTRAAEQAFLAALSATANISLSAAAAGYSSATFYGCARRNPGFAREMRMALATGYERLEMALLESYAPESHADDAWRHNDPPPIPSMTASEALHLLTLHRKTVAGEVDPLRPRRGETSDVWSLRVQMMAEARAEREREKFRVAEAAREARGEPRWLPPDPDAPMLPALDQVTGWSKASGRPAKGKRWGLFGGGGTRGRGSRCFE